MRAEEVTLLFAYNAWANARVLDAAAKVNAEQFVQPAGLSHSSVRGALVHVMGPEYMWRTRCQEGVFPKAPLAEQDFPTLDALRARWREEEAKLLAYVGGLRDDDLARAARYQTTAGVAHETPLWQVLVHLVNHGTQFRGEAAVALTQMEHSPGNLDLMAWLRERG
ncbi:MAG: hypothetical protein EXR47_03115 [Dehalococcoidia bacterium]|nr:hypothetical protein [Dehalococcoidia bacterium]